MLNLTELIKIIEQRLLAGEFVVIGGTLGGEPPASLTMNTVTTAPIMAANANANTTANAAASGMATSATANRSYSSSNSVADVKGTIEQAVINTATVAKATASTTGTEAEKLAELNPIRFAVWQCASFLLHPSDPRFSFTKSISTFGSDLLLSFPRIPNSLLEGIVFERQLAKLLEPKILAENARLAAQDPARFSFTQTAVFLKENPKESLIASITPEETLLKNLYSKNSLAQIKKWKSRLLSFINDCLIEYYKADKSANSQAEIKIDPKLVYEVFIPAFKVAFGNVAKTKYTMHIESEKAKKIVYCDETLERDKASFPGHVSIVTNLLLGVFIENEIRLEMGRDVSLSRLQNLVLIEQLLGIMQIEADEYNLSADQPRRQFKNLESLILRSNDLVPEEALLHCISNRYKGLLIQKLKVRKMHWEWHCMASGGTESVLVPEEATIELAKHVQLQPDPKGYSLDAIEVLRNNMVKFYKDNPNETLHVDQKAHLKSMWEYHTNQLANLKRRIIAHNQREKELAVPKQGKMLFLMELSTQKAKTRSLSSIQTAFAKNALFHPKVLREVFDMLEGGLPAPAGERRTQVI